MSPQTKPAPAQEMLKKEICLIESDLNTVRQRRDAGFGNEERIERILQLDKKLKLKKKNLKRKTSKALLKRKYRAAKKEAIKKLITKDLHLSKELKVTKFLLYNSLVF